MSYTLILNKGHEELISEHASMEAAFDAGERLLNDGYILRVTDEAGAVQYTQVLQDGVVAIYKGDATTASLASAAADAGNADVPANASLKIIAAAILLVLFFVALRIAAAYFSA